MGINKCLNSHLVYEDYWNGKLCSRFTTSIFSNAPNTYFGIVLLRVDFCSGKNLRSLNIAKRGIFQKILRFAKFYDRRFLPLQKYTRKITTPLPFILFLLSEQQKLRQNYKCFESSIKCTNLIMSRAFDNTRI